MTLIGDTKKHPFRANERGELEPNREYWAKHFPELSADVIPDCDDVRMTRSTPYIQQFGRAERVPAGNAIDAINEGWSLRDYVNGGYVPPLKAAPVDADILIGGFNDPTSPASPYEGRAAVHSINETDGQIKRAVFDITLRRYARTFWNSFRDELDALWPLMRFAMMYGGSAAILYWIVVAVSWMGGN